MGKERNKLSCDIKTEDYWFLWIKKYGNPNKHKQRIFGDTLRDIHFEIVKLIINKNFNYKMPYNLGKISVKKYKPKLRIKEDGTLDTKKLKPDWAKTLAYWKQEYPGKSMKELKEIKDKKLFYHLNKHTNGYTYRFVWSKWKAKVPNINSYQYYPATKLLKYLSKRLKEDSNLEYYEI